MYNSLQDYIHVIKKNNIKCSSVIEIGSRDGIDADILRKELGLNGENIHVIEANPNMAFNIRMRFPDMKTHNVAFSDTIGQSDFYQVNSDRDDFNGLSSILYRKEYEVKELNIQKIKVNTITASSFIDEYNLKDIVVKIDVEGFSYEVLKGFEEKLSEIMCIHVETEDIMIWDNQKTTFDIFNLLKNDFIRVTKKMVSDENHYTQYDEIWVNKKYYLYTLDNYFDKIFYINLDKDVDRNRNILEQFSKYSITNYERLSATELTEVPKNHLWRNFNVQFLSKKYILGSLGTRNSHWRIIDAAWQRDYERILIFEDDILINEDPNKVLEQNKDLLNSWDMLYFGGIEEPHFGGQIVCAHAYAMNKKIMQECYFMLPTSGMEVDNFYAKVLYHMSYNYSPTGKYLIEKMNPFNTIIQDKSHGSNIRG